MKEIRNPRNDPTKTFLDVVKNTCRQHGVRIYFGNGKWVTYTSIRCLGYFDDIHHTPPRLAVATGRPLPEWLPIAVHEFAHLLQWVEDSPVWKDQVISPTAYALDLFNEWMDGKDFSQEHIARLVRVAREVERDCEARTLALIKTHRLPINPVIYAQKANSYIFSYSVMARTRKLYVRVPRHTPELWKLMPKKILPEEAYEHIPEDYFRAFLTHCY